MKKLVAFALSLVLLLSATAVTAAAFDPEAFWAQNGAALAARGITQYGEHAFREGLMPVMVHETWNYINEKLEVVDLNQGRFDYVFPFYDGLAAVANDDGVGYIDKSGKLVIPCRYGTYSGMGEVWVGYFHDGTATVLKESCAMQMQSGEAGFPAFSPGQWEVGTIDKTGRLVEAYHTVEGMREGLHMVADYGAVSDGASEPASGVGIYFTDVDGWLDNGLPYAYTITNHTEAPVDACCALLSYMPQRWYLSDDARAQGLESFSAQLHSIDVSLQPGESVSGSLVSGFGGLSDKKLVWITFESPAERSRFLEDEALQDQFGYMWVTSEQWLKDNFNITLLPAN